MRIIHIYITFYNHVFSRLLEVELYVEIFFVKCKKMTFRLMMEVGFKIIILRLNSIFNEHLMRRNFLVSWWVIGQPHISFPNHTCLPSTINYHLKNMIYKIPLFCSKHSDRNIWLYFPIVYRIKKYPISETKWNMTGHFVGKGKYLCIGRKK